MSNTGFLPGLVAGLGMAGILFAIGRPWIGIAALPVGMYLGEPLLEVVRDGI